MRPWNASTVVFTTMQAAMICRVSVQTITKQLDRGYLKGFRVPGSKHRRIRRQDLIEYMQANGLSLEVLNNGDR